MSTQNQIDSVRINGAKSRGPVTPEGKAVSSANSLKHGLFARAIVITGEAADQFSALSEQFHAEFTPGTETEAHYLETMIMCRWRLRRVWELESASMNHEIEKLSAALSNQSNRTRAAIALRNLADQSHSLDLLNRYETKYARAFLRAHQALLELQTKPAAGSGEYLGHAEAVDDPAEKEILRNEPDGPPLRGPQPEPEPSPVL